MVTITMCTQRKTLKYESIRITIIIQKKVRQNNFFFLHKMYVINLS